MKTSVDEEIQKNSEWAAAVQGATEFLTGLVARSPFAPSVEADWSLAPNGGPAPEFLLKLSDDLGAAEGRFSREEFKNDSELRWRLRWLWGDVLADRSRKQLEKLRQTVEALDGD
jgi:hypothetical protein